MGKTTVHLGEGYKTTIQSRHHVYHADEPVDKGGTDAHATPSEMLLGALGSCIAITMKLYAERKGWQIDSVDIELDFERFSGKDYADYDGEAAFVHEFRKHIIINGDLDEKQRERLLDIAGKCPVHRALAMPAFFVEAELEADNQPE